VSSAALREFAHEIIERLRARGHEAWLVGGCVRDLLLRLDPKDYDVATSALPEQVMLQFPRAEAVGAHFGVVLVKSGDFAVEVATFRSDHAYRDGRRPETVTYETDPRRDVLRRDFTINALLMDPVSGEVLDHVGGREDLERRLVRTVGDPDQRFSEDRLRMLRAVRFAARLGFDIERATHDAIRRLCGTVTAVSAERIRDELLLILTEGGARRGFEMLDQTGLIHVLLPEIAAMKGVEQPPEFHPEGDVWTHTLLMLDELREPSAALALGVLLHDVGKPPTFRVAARIRFDGHVEAGVEIAKQILSRFRISKDESEQVLALIGHHMRFMNAPRMKESTLKRFLRLPRFDEHLELHRVDCLSSHRHLDTYDFVRRKLTEIPAETLRPPRLVTGNDLIHAGYVPGPMFSEILEAVEEAQLEGTVATRDEALALVRARWPQAGR
jgi:poly(A) polymerase